MKIAFVGTQCNGKSTVIEEFIKKYPMYKQPETSYRDIIKEKKLKLNQKGDEKSQKIILNALIDQIQDAVASDQKHMVFDRCIIDNMAYSLWLNNKGKVSDSFIIDSRFLVNQTVSLFDLIFYIPLRNEIPLVKRSGRDIDPVFREEIDLILDAMVGTYEKNKGIYFPLENCPAVIRLDGPPDLRVPQIRMYLKDNGLPFGEEDGSLIS